MSRVGTWALRVTAPFAVRRFEHRCSAPAEAQQGLLAKLLADNADSEYGRRHGFAGVTTFSQFQQRVPLSTYDDLEPYVRAAMNGRPNQLTAQTPVLFTTTSGTTGARKYIPMTPDGRHAKARAMRLWFAALLHDHPRMDHGKVLSLVSPEVESRAPNGVACGAESGHTYRNMPRTVRSIHAAPYDVFTIGDYEAKYYTLVRVAAGKDVTGIITPNPSTILVLADRLGRHTESIVRDVHDGTLAAAVPPAIHAQLGLRPDPARARQLEGIAANAGGTLLPGLVWPRLAAIGCWKGGTVGSYLVKFESYFPRQPPVRDLGYLATELHGSIPLSDNSDAGVLAVLTNVVEFRPADDGGSPDGRNLLRIEQLEVGQRYFIFVTNAAGLYRYDMNDIVEVVGKYAGTPLIRFVQKGKGVVSYTGEKLYESQILAAVDEAFAARRGRYQFIAAVAAIAPGESVPSLTFLVEFDDPVDDGAGAALAAELDAALSRHNSEYESKRSSSRYGSPVLRLVRPGEFDRYRRRTVEGGERADGQFKILRLTSDESFAKEFDFDRELIANGPSPA
jgi:GH3 auxin-responsive promoter